MRTGGYKGFGSSTNRKFKTAAVRSVYELLGGTSEGKMRRRNPTTKNLIDFCGNSTSSTIASKLVERKSRAKSVAQYEDGVLVDVWESAKQIEELTNGVYRASGVQKACREGIEYKGYEWCYC